MQATAKPIIPAIVLPAVPASDASAPVAASAPVEASTPVTQPASAPAVASAPVAASDPGPASTPIVNVDVFGDDQAMGIQGYSGMSLNFKPSSASLQGALRKQFNDTGITIANHASGGRAAALMNLLDGMDGGGAPLAQRLATTQSTIVVIAYGMNEQYGGETASDFGGYLAQAIQAIRDARRQPILETPSPTCDSDHPFTADYAAAIKKAGVTYGVPVIDNYAAISSLSGWKAHMDSTCTLPDEALQALRAQQELTVIAPIVKAALGESK